MKEFEKQNDVKPIMGMEEIKDFFFKGSQLNPNLTFENFVGDGFAVSLGHHCIDSSLQKGSIYNKCYFFGDTGRGKTHLVNAIGNAIKQVNPKKNVLYVDAETFERQYYCATVDNERETFLRFYQSADVLIVDDIQFFSQKEATQRAFLQIFNYLEQNEKQIILTADCPLIDLETHLNERLFSRISGMCAVHLPVPTSSTMCKIISTKYPEIEDGDIINLIMSNFYTPDLRPLDGVAKTIAARLRECPEFDLVGVKSIVSIWKGENEL